MKLNKLIYGVLTIFAFSSCADQMEYSEYNPYDAGYVMMLSLFRDFILSVPLTLILPRLSGVTMALYSGPIADIISFGAAVLFMCRILRELDRLEDNAGKRSDVPGNIQSLEKAGC